MVKRALEILTDDPNRVKPFLTEHFPLYGTAAFGFGAVCFVNWTTRRPVFSGIQKHLFATLLGGFVGNMVDKYRDEHMAERDAVLRHYVELHPDLFPDPERKKYGDLLQPWVPVR